MILLSLLGYQSFIEIKVFIFPPRLTGGVLLAAGVAALGGFAVQQLAGAGGLGGVQGLLSQENSGPQIATRCHKLTLFF